eukprot:749812-Hanusia_phi.AAC.2
MEYVRRFVEDFIPSSPGFLPLLVRLAERFLRSQSSSKLEGMDTQPTIMVQVRLATSNSTRMMSLIALRNSKQVEGNE